MKVCAVIVAGGQSLRYGGEIPKQFIEVAGRPLLSWTISRFEKASIIDEIVVVAAEEYLPYVSERVIDPFDFGKVRKVVAGGKKRSESVLKGLSALPISCNYAAIHDGARPLVAPDDINRVVETAMHERAAILAIPATDTVKRVKDSFILSTQDRKTLFLAQTPQVFQYDLIIGAHREYASNTDGDEITDDASLIEKKGFKVKIVEPKAYNPKVTGHDDMVIVEALLKKEKNG